MSGERSQHFVDLAARAGQRLVERLRAIEDAYGALGGDPNVLTWDEVTAELQERGHMAPDPGCTSPTCEKARRLVADAMQATFGGQV